jgi:hydroxyacyl-ACP dehydratase HTD2-like protein with hotdog domain
MSTVPKAAPRRPVSVGDELPVLRRTPTRVTLFLFGVAYWTSHRIHYDLEAARSEGFPDVLVTANLLSAYNVELLTSWTGDPHCVLSLKERYITPAFADEELTVTGRVVELADNGNRPTATCALSITKDPGTTVAFGVATVALRPHGHIARR